MENKLEIAFLHGRLGRYVAFGFPVTAIPKHDGASAIFALRDRAFKVTVVEGMVFDLDRQPLVGRIERWAASDGPGFEDAIKLQSQIVMEASGIMLLDDEPKAVRRPNIDVAGRFFGFLKIALSLISRNLARHHASPASAVVLNRLHIRSQDKPVDERSYRLFLSQVIDHGDRIGCNGFQNLWPGPRLGRIEKSFTRLPFRFQLEIKRMNYLISDTEISFKMFVVVMWRSHV